MKFTADVLDVCRVVFPDYHFLCLFDWSSCHDCLEDNAANLNDWNKGIGLVRKGVEILPMPTTILAPGYATLPTDSVQYLVFQPGDPQPSGWRVNDPDWVGRCKGIEQVLVERGLILPAARMNKPEMLELLKSQPDFKNQPSALVSLCSKITHCEALMLPKFHCELNVIELVWGHSKTWVRKHCDYKWSTLKVNVPGSLLLREQVVRGIVPSEPGLGVQEMKYERTRDGEGLPMDGMELGLFQLYCRKVHTYHECYRQGANGRTVHDVYQVFKSHRKVPASDYNIKYQAAVQAARQVPV